MIFDINITNILTLALTNLNATFARKVRENKIINYLIFNKKKDKNVNDFIVELKKAFTVNRIVNNRKYVITISCLKSIAANFYNGLNKITNWNTIGQ